MTKFLPSSEVTEKCGFLISYIISLFRQRQQSYNFVFVDNKRTTSNKKPVSTLFPLLPPSIKKTFLY